MAKVTLTDISSGYSSKEAINTNNDAIEAGFENTLSRDGTAPNQMAANLDMNSYRILNLPTAVGNAEPITLAQAASIASVSTAFSQENVGAVLYPATSAETAASVTPTNYYYPPGNVLRYGATGDGTTDDSTNVQKAFHAGVGTVVFPYTSTGYSLETEITVPSNTRVIGEGMVKILQGLTDIRLFALDDAVNVTIEGLHFDGNALGTTASTASMNIAIESIDTSSLNKFCTVKNCIFEDFYSWPVRFAGLASPNESNHVQVTHNYFYDQFDEGIVMYRVNHTNIEGNHFVNHAKEAIKVTSAGNTTIAHNVVRAAATGANDGPLINVGTDVFDATVTGNFVYQGNIGIGIEKGWTRVTITGNVCVGQGQRGIGVSLAATQTGEDCTITGNTVRNGGEAGINVVGVSGATIKGVTISGNRIQNVGTASNSNGINVNFTDDVTITGNSVRTVTKHGISVANNSFAVVSGNFVERIDQHGIRVEATGTHAVINDNIISRVNENAGSLDGISVAGITSATIIGNNIMDAGTNMRYGIDSSATTTRCLANIIANAQTADYNGVNKYTVTNGSADRAFDANAGTLTASGTYTQSEIQTLSDSLSELADVVATLIGDGGIPQ